MSIDAVIEKRIDRDGRVRLVLAPRVDADSQDTCPGRSALTIIGTRTFEPGVGMEIWGGAGWVEIVDGADYDRKGSHLCERRPCSACGGPAPWAEICNEQTGKRHECRRCRSCGLEAPL